MQIAAPGDEGAGERAAIKRDFVERGEGWDCNRCAAYINGRSIDGPLKHLRWHEELGG